MKLKSSFVIGLLLVLIVGWIYLIFYFSSQPSGPSHIQSKKAVEIIYQLDEWLEFTDTAIFEKLTHLVRIRFLGGQYNTPNALIRKSAHIGIYLVLGFMTSMLVYLYKKRFSQSILLGVSFPTLIALLDEYQQGFIGRTSSIKDVIIDIFGALIGIFLGLSFLLFLRGIGYVRSRMIIKLNLSKKL